MLGGKRMGAKPLSARLAQNKLSGYRNRETPGLHNQQLRDRRHCDRENLQSPLADRTLLQVDQAKPSRQTKGADIHFPIKKIFKLSFV